MIIPPNAGQPITDSDGKMFQTFRTWTALVSDVSAVSSNTGSDGIIDAGRRIGGSGFMDGGRRV